MDHQEQVTIETLIKEKIRRLTGDDAAIEMEPVGGGCINQAYRIRYGRQLFFCKDNSASKFPHLFEKEKNGLALLRGQGLIRVPEVLDCFEWNGRQVLLLEWISERPASGSFWTRFGRQLAALHQVSRPQFGLEEDNYMGSVHQPNRLTDRWVDFFVHQRLEPLISRCRKANLLTSHEQQAFEKLYPRLPGIFGNESKPALVHGDLWSGNMMCDNRGQPVLIDPAAYFGHPAVDLGMTTLFGGFHASFYEAYHYHAPFPSNHREQWMVCNLYPLLIHLLLFGTSYLGQIRNTLQQFE